MAGHNKWSKVKHIKAKEDAKRGKVFSKCAHEIAIAARDGGGDPSMNPRLRAAIDSAKAVSMPKDNIDRAIRKGTGEGGGEAIQEVTYEGYGPSGTAFQQTTWRPPGSTRNVIGSSPQSSPSSWTGTCVPEDSARTSVASKDSIARLRGLRKMMPQKTSGRRSEPTRSTRTVSSLPLVSKPGPVTL